MPRSNQSAARPAPSLMQRIAIGTMGLARPFAGGRVITLYGLIEHRGRRSGTVRRTPIVARRTPSGFVIPVPFGPGTNWVQNVMAAGDAVVRWNGRDWPVRAPRLIGIDEAGEALAPVQRRLARRAGIVEFLALEDVPA